MDIEARQSSSAPPGLVPNVKPLIIPYDTFLGVIWAGAAVSGALLTCRLVSRFLGPRRIFLDDAFIFFAFLPVVVSAALWQWGAKDLYYFFDVQAGKALPQLDFLDRMKRWLLVAMITKFSFFTSLALVKFSILFFFRRLGQGVDYFRYVWWPVFVFTLLTYLAGVGSIEYYCLVNKTSYIMEHCSKPKHNRTATIVLKVNGGLDIVSDFLIMLLPVILLWNIRIQWMKKTAILGLFALTILTVVIAIVRMVNVDGSIRADGTYDYSHIGLWSATEPVVAICVACLSAFPQLFTQSSRNKKDSFSPSETYLRMVSRMRASKRSREDQNAIDLSGVTQTGDFDRFCTLNDNENTSLNSGDSGKLVLVPQSPKSKFRKIMKETSQEGSFKIPVVPYWTPGLFHAISLLSLPNFLGKLRSSYGSIRPLLVRAGPMRFFVFNNPDHVKAAFRKSKYATNKSTTLFALRQIFGLPEEAVKFYRADDSGNASTSRKESLVEPQNRIGFLTAHNLHKHLSGVHLENLSNRYIDFLLRDLSSFDVQDEWVSLPDLHDFIQKYAMTASLKATFGTELFKQCPNVIDDLMDFNSRLPDFIRCLPRWLAPGAHRVRERLLSSVKKWHDYAHKHFDCSKTGPEDPEWEPYFGSKLIRVRQQYLLQMEKVTAQTRAVEDLGFMFGSTANVVSALFWFVYESLKDPSLLQSLLEETHECGSSRVSHADLKKLAAQPLLQSAYAETLRLYVASASTRVAEYHDLNIAGFHIPKDSYLVIYGRTLALDHEAWSRAGRTSDKPLQEFDPERFLVDADWVRPGSATVTQVKTVPAPSCKDSSGSRRFSLDGLLGLWIPFGGGDHLCPGRHFTKHQILLTFSVLFSHFDIELGDPNADKVQPDFRYALSGTLPPSHCVPFRIRRKSAV
ncbi:Cytochrome P462 monooxygenase [Paramyrothecium foliicola]|nr:Cytochrome P462 monooxygenase [Paramyrothecium foliicola]